MATVVENAMKPNQKNNENANPRFIFKQGNTHVYRHVVLVRPRLRAKCTLPVHIAPVRCDSPNSQATDLTDHKNKRYSII